MPWWITILFYVLCQLERRHRQKKRGKDWENICFYISKYEEIFEGKILIWNKESQLSCTGLIEYQKTSALAYGFKLWSLLLKKTRQEGTLICGCKSRKQLRQHIFWHLFYDRILFESNFVSHDFMLTSLQILEMLLINIVELIN